MNSDVALFLTRLDLAKLGKDYPNSVKVYCLGFLFPSTDLPPVIGMLTNWDLDRNLPVVDF